MSSETPPETNRIRKIAGSLKGKVSSLLHLPRAPTPSSSEVDSSFDIPTRWVIKFFSPTFHWSIVLLSISPMVPVVGVDHTLTTEAYTLSPGPPFSVPVSGLLSVPGPASGRGLETPPTVSDHAVLTIIVANYWSFSTCLWPLVHQCPHCPVLSRQYPRNQNKVTLWV